MTRAEIHRQFVTEFAFGDSLGVAVDVDIQGMEQALRTVLPESYIAFIKTQGAVFTPSLLDLVVERNSELRDIRQILPVHEAARNTKLYWSGGMSEDLIGFASDCMGNMFCFRRFPPDTPRPDDAEVWLFDHDYCRNEKCASSFDEWLSSFLKLRRQELPG
jgi:hypothetical protein